MDKQAKGHAAGMAAIREPVTIERYVYIPMRDGTELAADVYRPARPGKFPAMACRTPYGRALPELANRLRALASHGYVVVANDARGTGESEGTYDWYNYIHGPMDGYDFTEWIAQQPWCDGNVGMFGGSALGVYCWHAAVQQPPHLKALFVTTGAGTDGYIDQWFVGGVFQARNRIGWAQMPRLGLPVMPLPGEPAAEQRMKVYRQRFEEMERRLRDGKSPLNLDWFVDAYQHPTDGAYWREKSAYPHLGKITIPVYQADHWRHFITGTLRAYQQIKGPKKLALFPREFVDFAPVVGYGRGSPQSNRVDLDALQVRWFDRWLKGIDNGVMDEPPILLHVQGEDAWRQEQEWPLARTRYQKLYFHPGPSGSAKSLNDGLLSWDPPAAGGSKAAYTHDPGNPVPASLDAADRRQAESRTLTFSTAPLAHDLEVTGPVTVHLYGSSSASDTDWIANLTDVGPDGASRFLNIGALKASHRESHEKPSPLAPETVYEFKIDVWPTSNLFKAGHRIRLSVASSDYPTFEVHPQKALNQVYMDASHPSHVVLPVIPT